MSSVSGVSSNFGNEALAVAMAKRSNDEQGKAALSLLEGAVQTTQQIQAKAPAATGALGSRIDIMA